MDVFESLLGIEAREPVLMLAPMEGVTNHLFREALLHISDPDIVATEFIRICSKKHKLKPFPRHKGATLQIQFMASEEEALGGAIEFLKTREVLSDDDWIDLNVGCPSRRVNSHGAGAALLKEPEKLLRIVARLREAHSGPLSVKTRLGFEDSSEFPQLLSTLEALPIDFLSLHARSRCGGDAEEIRLDMLAEAVNNLPFPVIGNGDIKTKADAERMLEATGARGLMCGRGATTDPFLFEKIRGRAISDERLQLCSFALALADAYQASEAGERMLGVYKEFISWLSLNPLVGREIFAQVKRTQSFEEAKQRLRFFFEPELIAKPRSAA